MEQNYLYLDLKEELDCYKFRLENLTKKVIELDKKVHKLEGEE